MNNIITYTHITEYLIHKFFKALSLYPKKFVRSFITTNSIWLSIDKINISPLSEIYIALYFSRNILFVIYIF